jgi:hypothetical protein
MSKNIDTIFKNREPTCGRSSGGLKIGDMTLPRPDPEWTKFDKSKHTSTNKLGPCVFEFICCTKTPYWINKWGKTCCDACMQYSKNPASFKPNLLEKIADALQIVSVYCQEPGTSLCACELLHPIEKMLEMGETSLHNLNTDMHRDISSALSIFVKLNKTTHVKEVNKVIDVLQKLSPNELKTKSKPNFLDEITDALQIVAIHCLDPGASICARNLLYPIGKYLESGESSIQNEEIRTDTIYALSIFLKLSKTNKTNSKHIELVKNVLQKLSPNKSQEVNITSNFLDTVADALFIVSRYCNEPFTISYARGLLNSIEAMLESSESGESSESSESSESNESSISDVMRVGIISMLSVFIRSERIRTSGDENTYHIKAIDHVLQKIIKL